MEALIAKGIERLGKKKLWILVHVVGKLPESERTAGGVRDVFRRVNLYLNDKEFTLLASQFSKGNGSQANGPVSTIDNNTPFDVEAFQRAFLPTINPRRQYILSLVLRQVEANESGFISFDNLLKAYDTLRHPNILLGMDTETLERSFLNDFWEAHSDGGITREELTTYLVGISHQTAGDEDFELHCIRSFSLDRPKRSLEECLAAAQIIEGRGKPQMGKKHPLYQSSSSEYGKKWEEAKYDGRFACNYSFTKSLQDRCSMGPSTMNM
uniref:EF-hand domain-containing protein n=1 Tax=Trypanosoma congolense (strain IL3000) TaxID=1068625 RepID=G0UQC9_TRYCI|nr:conserved hypothetical protein [Trypanosoma congolense IL3000]